MKTTVEPNIEKIEEFYELTLAQFKKASRQLKAIPQANSAAYQKKQVQLNNDFQELKRKFEYQFIYFAESQDGRVLGQLTSAIQELEDSFVILLDKINSQNDVVLQFTAQLTANKVKFYQSLYRPVQSRFKWPWQKNESKEN